MFPVNMRAPTNMMEKIKIPMDPMYLTMVRGVTFSSCRFAASAFAVSTSISVMIDFWKAT